MTKLLQLPDLLRDAGVFVRTLKGWDSPARSKYYYREGRGGPDADPAGHMHHHTASGGYTPNRDKANGYAGLSYEGSERLYQERYNEGNYFPVYTIANAYPAPISSGAGDINVLDAVRDGDEIRGRQGPDTPDWYGNTHYWNTEYVLDGTGSPLDPAVFDMMVVVAQVQNELMGWTEMMHIGHGHHTRRKIDLWDATWSNTNKTGFDLTIEALRESMGGDTPPIQPPIPPPTGDYMFPTLREGDGYLDGPNPEYRAAVKAEQIMLAHHGFADSKTQDGACAADGARGSGTTQASKDFQSAKGLVSDGICGPLTWEKLNEEVA